MSWFTGCVANNTRGSQSRNSGTRRNSKKWIFAPCANEDMEYLSDASDEETLPKKNQREAALSSVSTTDSSLDLTPVSTTASSLDVTPGKHTHSSFHLNDGPKPMYDPLDIDEDEDSTTGVQLNNESNVAPELDESEDTNEKAEEQDYITSPFEAFDMYLGIPKQVQATLSRPEVPVLTKEVEVPVPQTKISLAPKEVLTPVFIPKEATVRKMEKSVSEGSAITSPPAKHITEPSPEDDTTNFNDNIASTLPTPLSDVQVTKPSAMQGEIGTQSAKDEFPLGLCEVEQPVVQPAGIGGQDFVERNAEGETIGVISAVAFIRLRAAAQAAAANHESFVTQDGTETMPCLDKMVARKSGANVIGELIPVVGGVAVCFAVGLIGGWGIRKSGLMADMPNLS